MWYAKRAAAAAADAIRYWRLNWPLQSLPAIDVYTVSRHQLSAIESISLGQVFRRGKLRRQWLDHFIAYLRLSYMICAFIVFSLQTQDVQISIADIPYGYEKPKQI